MFPAKRNPTEYPVATTDPVTEVHVKSLIKLLVFLLVALLAVTVIVPLVALAGLFIWLKLTEEADD